MLGGGALEKRQIAENRLVEIYSVLGPTLFPPVSNDLSKVVGSVKSDLYTEETSIFCVAESIWAHSQIQ